LQKEHLENLREKEKDILKFQEIIEIDAALDIAYELKYLENYNTENLSSSMINSFKLLLGLIKATPKT